jgi:PIN domain nuclease of toxin-antitoxin system
VRQYKIHRCIPLCVLETKDVAAHKVEGETKVIAKSIGRGAPIHSCFRLLLFSGCILLVGCGMGYAQDGQSVDKKPALNGVLSIDCEQRANAVFAFLDESESRSPADTRRKIDAEVPEAKDYLREAIEYFELEEKANDESLRIVQSVIRHAGERFENTSKNTLSIADFVASNLRSAVLANSDPTRRLLIVHLVEQTKHYEGEPEGKTFSDTTKSLLLEKDSDIRAVVSASMLFRRIGKPSDLARNLVAGLESNSFGVRYASSRAIKELGAPQTCYNPLDSPIQRTPALKIIREWSQSKLR